MKKNKKIAIAPSAQSCVVPTGTIIDAFMMHVTGNNIRVAVVEVPASMLAVRATNSLQSCICGVAVATTIEYTYEGGNRGIELNDGDVIVYVSEKFNNFTKKVRQILVAYEAAEAAGIYLEATAGGNFINKLAIEDCCLQYLASLDYWGITVFSALKKLNRFNTKQSKRFFKACRKQTKKSERLAENIVTSDDMDVLASLA